MKSAVWTIIDVIIQITSQIHILNKQTKKSWMGHKNLYFIAKMKMNLHLKKIKWWSATNDDDFLFLFRMQAEHMFNIKSSTYKQEVTYELTSNALVNLIAAIKSEIYWSAFDLIFLLKNIS